LKCDLWYLNGARYYDPTLRRFITPDTIIQDYYNPQDLNRYSYAWNNPLRITDPTGHLEDSQMTYQDSFYNKLYLWNQNPYFSATATFSQAFLTAPFTMPYRIGYSTGELIDSLFNSPANWMARGDTPPSIVSMKNAFNAGNPNPAINMLGTAAGDFVASYIAGRALMGGVTSVEGVVNTPYGKAIQSMSKEAVAVRQQVEQGATLFKIGTLGKSEAAESQFWSLEHPLSSGYANKFGIPESNVFNADFIISGRLKTGVDFITRNAPGVGINNGGGIEVVAPANSISIDWFSIINKR